MSPTDKTLPQGLDDVEALEQGRLGRMAYLAGWLAHEQLADCLGAQKRATRSGGGRPPRFGDVAIERGFLSAAQVEALLRIQAINRPKRYDQTLGAMAVVKGWLTQGQVDRALAVQRRLLQKYEVAPLLGILLVEMGMLTEEQVRWALRQQDKRGKGPLRRLRRAVRTAEGGTDEADESAAPEGRIVCRCRVCSHTELRVSWEKGERCPTCGAKEFSPVPLGDENIGYATADRSQGPAVEDTRLGAMAYFAGWLDRDQINACMARQRDAATRGEPVPKFGEVAIAAGMLSEVQVRALLRIQVIHRPEAYEKTFGALAVRLTDVTQTQVDACLAIQTRLLRETTEAPVLGLIMMEKKLLNARQVKAILDLQARHRAGSLAELERSLARARFLLRLPLRLESVDLRSPRLWVGIAVTAALTLALIFLLARHHG